MSRRTLLPIAVALILASNIVAADTSKCKMVQIVDLPVRLERNRLIVDGAINGQKKGRGLVSENALISVTNRTTVRSLVSGAIAPFARPVSLAR